MNAVVPVYDHPVETKTFVERGLWNNERQFGECTTVGFANPEEGLVAGFVYHNYEPDSGVIELSGYSTRRDWANRGVVALIFGEYPFIQLDCRLMVARYSEHNKRVRRIWKSLGASEYVIPELRNQGEAEVIAVLHRDKFMKSRFMRAHHG